MEKTKLTRINSKEQEKKFIERVYFVDPTWIHLDKKELQELISQDQKIFKVNFGDIE